MTEVPGVPMPAPPAAPRGYRSAAQRARLAMVALLGFVAVEIVAIVADAGRVDITNRLIRGDEVTDAEITSSDSFVHISAFLEIAALVACAVFFMTWLHRTVANLPELGARNLRFTPGWAVGWWFVPIANLVKPFQAMGEAWTASSPEHDAPLGVLLPLWWGLLVLGEVVSRLVVIRSGGDDITGLRNSAVVDIVASVVLMLAALLCVVVVRRLTERQEITHRGLAAPPTAAAAEA